MSHARIPIELVGDVARKRGPASQLAIEVAKTTAAGIVAARTGRFHVPAVVSFDAETGVLETERVHGFVSLMELAVRRDRRLVDLCERVGGAIAHVHGAMQLPDAMRIPLPAPLAGEPADECGIHGDLNGLNVGCDPSSDQVVILDWSAAPALRVSATVGSRYFDVLWFGHYFFRLRPVSALIGWSPERWAGAFMTGYSSVCRSFSADALRAYHERARPFLTSDYRIERERRKRGAARILYGEWQQIGVRRWERFLASLSDPHPSLS